ncbi:MAG: carbohydrate porin [Pseudolabrys sp.]
MRRWCLILAVGAVLCGGAVAQAAEPGKPAEKPKSLWEQETLTGDWGGARTALSDRGIDLGLTYTNEVLSVLSGGLQERSVYAGLMEFTADVNLQKLMGWNGAKTHVSVFQIQNTKGGIIAAAGSISDPSNIDALQTTRLFNAWFEQSFGNVAWLRIGQMAADSEFFWSDTAGALLNGTFGWGTNLAANMLRGGPAYPLATPGVRLKFKPSDDAAIQGAVFAGDPAGSNCGAADDPQKCNRHGFAGFGLDGGALFLGEAQYSVNQGKHALGLPGVYKLGGWYATADFADQHYGIGPGGAALTLADPSMPDPLYHRGNSGIYAVADQMVWRGGDSSLNVFVRGGLSPADRNLVSYYVDGGFGLKGPLPGRPNDRLTFGVAYAKISRDAVALDRDNLAIGGPPYAVRSAETVFEASYLAQLAPWWTVQPDVQYILHPSGGQDPDDPTQTLGHVFIAGVRSVITF